MLLSATNFSVSEFRSAMKGTFIFVYIILTTLWMKVIFLCLFITMHAYTIRKWIDNEKKYGQSRERERETYKRKHIREKHIREKRKFHFLIFIFNESMRIDKVSL